jgi:hypothetical protein
MKNKCRFFPVQSRKADAALAGMAAVELAVEMVPIAFRGQVVAGEGVVIKWRTENTLLEAGEAF